MLHGCARKSRKRKLHYATLLLLGTASALLFFSCILTNFCFKATSSHVRLNESTVWLQKTSCGEMFVSSRSSSAHTFLPSTINMRSINLQVTHGRRVRPSAKSVSRSREPIESIIEHKKLFPGIIKIDRVSQSIT